MKLAIHSLAASGAALWLLAAAPAFAADPSTRPAAADPAAAKTDDPWSRRIKIFQIDGLPLSECAKLLSAQFHEINFIVPASTTQTEPNGEILSPRDFVVPPLELRNVTLDEILTALQIATAGRLEGARVPDAKSSQPNNQMVAFTLRPPAPPAPPAPALAKPATNCRVFSLARYLGGREGKELDLAIKNIHVALDLCWAMLDAAAAPGRAPRLSVHSETKLLIVVGEEPQLDVIAQVIKELSEGAAPARPTNLKTF